MILVLGSNATIHWVQCWPLEMLWHLQEEGSCIPKNIIIDYNVFAAGKAPYTMVSREANLLTLHLSLF